METISDDIHPNQKDCCSDKSDEIDFQSYIQKVKEEFITWDFFVQLMKDLANNEKRQKSLISVLLQELKHYLDHLRSLKLVENHEKFRENSILAGDVANVPTQYFMDAKSRANELNSTDDKPIFQKSLVTQKPATINSTEDSKIQSKFGEKIISEDVIMVDSEKQKSITIQKSKLINKLSLQKSKDKLSKDEVSKLLEFNSTNDQTIFEQFLSQKSNVKKPSEDSSLLIQDQIGEKIISEDFVIVDSVKQKSITIQNSQDDNISKLVEEKGLNSTLNQSLAQKSNEDFVMVDSVKQKSITIQHSKDNINKFGALLNCDHCGFKSNAENMKIHTITCHPRERVTVKLSFQKPISKEENNSIINSEHQAINCDKCGSRSSKVGMKIHSKICHENAMAKLSFEIPSNKYTTNSIMINENQSNNLICDKNQDEIMEEQVPPNSRSIPEENTKPIEHSFESEKQLDDQASIHNDIEIKEEINTTTEYMTPLVDDIPKMEEATRFDSEENLLNHSSLSPNHEENVDGNTEESTPKRSTRQELKCSNCEKSFPDSTRLKEHIRNKHKDMDSENIFACSTCKKAFPYLKLLNKHINFMHKIIKESVQCDICGKSWPDGNPLARAKLYLKNHYRVHFPRNEVKTVANTVACSICKSDFDSEKNLQYHMSLEHASSSSFNCPDCEAKFEEKSLLRSHIWDYHKKTNHICKFCQKSFKTPFFVGRHVRSVHKDLKGDISSLKCYFCPEYFLDTRWRKYHVEKKHMKLIIYQSFENYSEEDLIQNQKTMSKCVVCEKVFLNFKDLYEHNKINHSLKCDECNKSFIGLPKQELDYFLKRHKLICKYTNQTENDDMICKYCQKKFTQPNTTELVRHVQNIHERMFSCETCGKTFGQNDKLMEHIQVVHENLRNYPCDSCDKKFVTPKGLKDHKLRIHEKELNHICDTCGKKFLKRGVRNSHVAKYHEKKLDFKCEFCFEGFFNAPELKNHMKKAHENPELKCEICKKHLHSYTLLRKHKYNICA